MAYIKGRAQTYVPAFKKWMLINTENGAVVGHKDEPYPYVRKLHVHKRKVK